MFFLVHHDRVVGILSKGVTDLSVMGSGSAAISSGPDSEARCLYEGFGASLGATALQPQARLAYAQCF